MLNQVVDVLQEAGLKYLRIAPSSMFPIHAPLAEKIRDRTVTEIWTDYMIGPAADAVADGHLEKPAILQSHGGRARSICTGELKIDAAFIASPAVDRVGNVSSKMGRTAFGPMGYPAVDADYARKTVAITEELTETEIADPEIPASRIDHIVRIPNIGNPGQIKSGTTAQRSDPVGEEIAKSAAHTALMAGAIQNDFSFQTGAGGISLSTVPQIGKLMAEYGIKGSFISGGITGRHVELLQRGLFDQIYDVQSFDLESASSYAANERHVGMSADQYANPLHPDPIVNRLSLMVLGVVEIDRSFNINVVKSGNGRIIGGPGGHPDTAAGSQLTIAVTKLTGGGYPKVVDQVQCVCTPGRDIDLLVTEAGVAVNTGRAQLTERLRDGGVQTVEIDYLIDLANSLSDSRPSSRLHEPVGHIQYRDGTMISQF